MTFKPEPDLTRQVIRDVNSNHGTAFELVRRIPGGFQEGAYELVTPGGDRAVLKWNTTSTPASRLEEAARIIDRARTAGWPTPEWLTYGVTERGERYVVQELVDGEHRDKLDEATLDLLLEVNAIQADLKPETQLEWSAYAVDVIFGNRDGMIEQLARFSPEGEEFRRAISDLCGEDAAIHIPADDLVCGVFSLENILFHADSVAAIIDVGAVGRGCRAFDLAVLYSRIDLEDPGSRVVEARLREAAHSVAGEAVFNVCLAAEVVGVLAFGLRHWPDGVAKASRTWAQRFRDLA